MEKNIKKENHYTKFVYTELVTVIGGLFLIKLFNFEVTIL